MLDRFREFIEQHALLSSESAVLLAVSGGLDSMVMAELFRSAGYRIAIAHLNHGMRAEESDADEDLVRRYCLQHGITFHRRKVDLKAEASESGKGLQETGRRLRYEWMQDLCREHGYDKIATAHHLDDQVETVVMNVLRGSAPEKLSGIPVQRDNIIRPLLFTDRQGIQEFANAEGLSWREDSSNRDTKYLRNKVRHEILPKLEERRPGFREEVRIGSEAVRLLREELQPAIDSIRNKFIRKEGDTVWVSEQLLEPGVLFRLCLGEELESKGFHHRHHQAICDLKHSEVGAEFRNGQYRVLRVQEGIRISELAQLELRTEVLNGLDEMRSALSDWEWQEEEDLPKSFAEPGEEVWLDAEKLDFPLVWKYPEEGDRIQPLGMKGSMLLSDFFTQLKIDKVQRRQVRLLCKGTEVLWVEGFRISDKLRIAPGSRHIIHLVRREIEPD